MRATREAGFGDEVKRRIILGTYALSSGYYDAYYGQAQKVRTLISQDFETAFKQADVLVSPTAPTTAFPIGAKVDDPIAMYLNDLATIPANLSGVPGISVPSGLADEDGLPAGFQILAPALADDRVYRVGAALGGAVPALQTPPTTCTSGVAVFTPGFYDDAAALTTATGLCSVAWFKPGTYYFDFHNNSCANVCPSNVFGSGNAGSDLWDIPGNKPVIGGTPTDANGNVLSIPSTSPTMPGSCESPITSTTAVGVQFVFGGDSQIMLEKNAQVELCGTYHADRPPIVVYGLKTGSTPTVAAASSRQPSGTPTTSGSGTWTGVTAANLGTGGPGAVWTTSNASAASTVLTVPGFAPAAAIPAGAVLTGATVHVAHKEPDNKTTSNSSLTVKVGTTTTASVVVAAAGSTTTTTSNIVLNATTNATAFNSLQTEVHKSGYTGATIAYTANAKVAGATTVGPITLDLTYYLPVLRGEAGTCIDGSVSGCTYFMNLLQNGNNKIVFYLQGTTYVPLGDLNFTLSNFSAEIAKFGIVGRQLEFQINNGNPRYTGPIFEIPDNSPGYGYENTTVDLKVHLCTRSSCTTGDPVALTARVQLWDQSGSPVPPGRQVSVLTWAIQR